MPKFIAPQDRAVKRTDAAKQDCECNAAKRWLVTRGARMRDQRPVYLGGDLFACQPMARAILVAGGDFLLTVKPSSYKTVCDVMHGATQTAVKIAR